MARCSWKPCFFTGVATASFLQTAHGFTHNVHVADVLLGDRVQVFEENGEWLRGIVGCRPGDLRVMHAVKARYVRELFQTLQQYGTDDKSFTGEAVFRCRLGIFPRSIIHVQHVVDAENTISDELFPPVRTLSLAPANGFGNRNIYAFTRHSSEASDSLWHWKNLAYYFFVHKYDQEYNAIRKVTSDVVDLSKRLFQHLELLTEAEHDNLLTKLQDLFDKTSEQLGDDVMARDPELLSYIEPSECNVLELYRAYSSMGVRTTSDAPPNNSRATLNSKSSRRPRLRAADAENTSSLLNPAFRDNSVFPLTYDRTTNSSSAASPTGRPVHVPSHSLRSYDIVSTICRVKWSNFILARHHHGSTATTSGSKMHKSSSTHDTLAAVTSDSAGNYICLEFATAMYDAKTSSFLTEHVRHTIKLPLNRLREVSTSRTMNSDADSLLNNVAGFVFNNDTLQLSTVYAGLSFRDFSDRNDTGSIHLVVIVSRIFGSTLVEPQRRCDDGELSTPNGGPPITPAESSATYCTSTAEHDYSDVKVAIGCAVSRNLIPFFDVMLSHDQQGGETDDVADKLPLFGHIDVKTTRGTETLEPAISLSYFTLDVISAKDKTNIHRLLQYVVRQPRFSSQQPPTLVLYAATQIFPLSAATSTAGVLAGTAEPVPSNISKSDALSSKLSGGSTSVVAAAVDTNLYVLPNPAQLLKNSAVYQQHIQPLDSEREKEMDFVFTLRSLNSRNRSPKVAVFNDASDDLMPLQPVADMPFSRKMTLDKFVLPTDRRNDVYVTIKSLDVHLIQHAILTVGEPTDVSGVGETNSNNIIPALPKSIQPNVEILLSVCDRAGRVIKDAIVLPGSVYGGRLPSPNAHDKNSLGDDNTVRYASYYSSAVYWKDENPEWFETVRLSLLPSEMAHAHLRFVVRLRNKKQCKSQQPVFAHNGGGDKSTPKLKYFSFSHTTENAVAPDNNSFSSSLLFAPLKNDAILGVAYLPLNATDTGCVIKSGSYDLFVHRSTRAAISAVDSPPPKSSSTDRQSSLFDTGRRLFKSRAGLFSGNKTGRNSSNSHRSVSPSSTTRVRSSTSTVGSAAKRSVSPSVASLASVGESVDIQPLTPLPPPRHHHHLHTPPCEFDIDYLALPADQEHCNALTKHLRSIRKTSDAVTMNADANDKAGTTLVVKSTTTTTVLHDNDEPSGSVDKPRTKHVFAGIFIPSFGRSSKKKILAVAGENVSAAAHNFLNIDLAAGDVIMPDNAVTTTNHTAAGPVIFTRGVYATSSLDKLKVHVSVCSTEAVQNRHLLNLFKYASLTPAEIESSLHALISDQQRPEQVEFNEILQFLPDVLDALFGIMLVEFADLNNKVVENAAVEGEEHDSVRLLALKAVLYVIALFTCEKYYQFMPSLESYVRQHFYFPLVHRRLLRNVESIISTCANADSNVLVDEHGRTALSGARASMSKTIADDDIDSSFDWGILSRQRSSRSSIFYRDFASVEEEQHKEQSSGRRSADDLLRSENSVVSDDVEKSESRRRTTALMNEYKDLLADTVKYLPYLLSFIITSYLQNELVQAETFALNCTPMPTEQKSQRRQSPLSPPPTALLDATAASALPPTPPPRTTSRTSSSSSRLRTKSSTPTNLTTRATSVSTSCAASPKSAYHISEHISSVFRNFYKLFSGGQPNIMLYQSLMSALPDCIEMLAAVCSTEQIFTIIEQQLGVARRSNTATELAPRRRRSSAGKTFATQLYHQSGSRGTKRKSSEFYTPVQLLALSTTRLSFLKELLGSSKFMLAMLFSNASTFLDNVDTLCSFIVDELDISRANAAVTKLCGELITMLLKIDEREEIRDATLPRRSSRNGGVVRSFADLLVVRFFPAVVEILLDVIQSHDDESGNSSNEALLFDFLVILMSLLRFMNGTNLQAVLLTVASVKKTQPDIDDPNSEITVDIAQLRQYISDRLLHLVNQLLDHSAFFSGRWSLLVLEQCKYIYKFLLLLMKPMKRYFLPPPANVPSAAETQQPKKRHVVAVRPTSSSVLSDDDDDDGCSTVIGSIEHRQGAAEAEENDDEIDAEVFSRQFVDLWMAFISSCVKFCLAKPLQLEELGTTTDDDDGEAVQLGQHKTYKTLLTYGDMRLSMSSSLYGLWYSFGQHRPAFIPSIVYPILRLSLIPHPTLRARIIPLFFDMMQNEFYTYVLMPYDVDDEAVEYVQRREQRLQQHQQLKKRQQQQKRNRNSGDADNNNRNDDDDDDGGEQNIDDDIDMFFENDEFDYAAERSSGGGMRRLLKTNCDLFAQEIITRIDELLDQGFGDWVYLRQFRDAMSTPLDSGGGGGGGGGQSKMFDCATDLIERLCQQMALLLRYREKFTDASSSGSEVMSTTNSAAAAAETFSGGDVYTKMACTYAVMDFYDQIERHELYIRYLYRLRDLHLQHNDFTEIAFTLEHHAKLLAWSDEPLSDSLQPIPSAFDEESSRQTLQLFFTHRQLKEDLFRQMIECFERSQLWEFGIQMCKELAGLYENDLYDYESLSQILKKQASLFQNIVEQGDSRPVSNYFYVGFWGNGFDAAFRNLHFVYRGAPFESLMQFQQRMRERFPRAELLTNMNEPSGDVKDGDDDRQYLQICRVEPISYHLIYGGTSCGSSSNDDGGIATIDRMMQNKAVSSAAHGGGGGGGGAAATHVSWKIRKFYEHNEVSMFTYSQVLKNPPTSLTGGGGTDQDKPKKSENAALQFARMWIERTTFATKTTLPYLLRWSEVRYYSKTIISPCKTAVENVQSKSRHITLLAEKQVDALQQKLKSMQRTILTVRNGAKNVGFTDSAGTLTAARGAAIKPSNKQNSSAADLLSNSASYQQPARSSMVLMQEFTQTLLGVLDPAVQGGIPMYEQAFLNSTSGETFDSGPIDPVDIESLKCAIAETVPILEVALTVHEVAMCASGVTVQQNQKGLHEHLVEKFHEFKASTYAKYGERSIPPFLSRLMKDAVNAHAAFETPSSTTTVQNNSRLLRSSAPYADDPPYVNYSAAVDGAVPLPRERSSTSFTADNTKSGGKSSKVKMRNNSVMGAKTPTTSLATNRSVSVRHSAASTSGYISSSSSLAAAHRQPLPLLRPLTGISLRQQNHQNSTLTSARSFISANNVYSTSVISSTKKRTSQSSKVTKHDGDKPKSLRKHRKMGAHSTAATTESSSSSGPMSHHHQQQFGTLTRSGKVRDSFARVTKQTQNVAGTMLSSFKRHLSSVGLVTDGLENAYYYDSGNASSSKQLVDAEDNGGKKSLSMLTPNRLSHILGSSSEINSRHRRYSVTPQVPASSTTPSTMTAGAPSSSSSSSNANSNPKLRNAAAVRSQILYNGTVNITSGSIVAQLVGSRASIASVSTSSSTGATAQRETASVTSASKNELFVCQSDAVEWPPVPPKSTSTVTAPPPPPPPPLPLDSSQRSSNKPPVAAKPASLTTSKERLSRLQQSNGITNRGISPVRKLENSSTNYDSAASAAAQLPPLPDKVRVRTRTTPGIRAPDPK